MKPDLMQVEISRVGIALSVILTFLGLALTAATGMPAIGAVCVVLGLYFLFAIRVANQWQKTAVLRFGRYTGLRGPPAYHIIPIIDSLSRTVAQRDHVANVS